jgi:hypothetical protein
MYFVHKVLNLIYLVWFVSYIIKISSTYLLYVGRSNLNENSFLK